MAKVNVKYIIGHWSAGGYTPNAIDLNSYDILITGDGKQIKGNKYLDNTKASTAGMNSITLNISCCGGTDKTSITKIQFEAFCRAVANFCKQFNINPSKFYTHHEIGELCRSGKITMLLPMNGYLKKNIGKIDLTKLPYEVPKNMSYGNFIRKKVKWYYEKI